MLALATLSNMTKIKAHVHWQCLYKIMPAISERDIAFLNCLGCMTQIGSFLFMSHRSRWPRQVQWWLSCVAVAGIIVDIFALNFANVNTALGKHSLVAVAGVFMLKRCLHWWRWCDNAGDRVCDNDTLVNRNNPICVMSSKVAKASKDTCSSWCYCQQMLPMS